MSAGRGIMLAFGVTGRKRHWQTERGPGDGSNLRGRPRPQQGETRWQCDADGVRQLRSVQCRDASSGASDGLDEASFGCAVRCDCILPALHDVVVEYGQLRRNTERCSRHRHAALCLATNILIVGKLITWRDQWCPS
jgi:hypothetical protein